MMGMDTLQSIDDGMLCMDVPEKEVAEQKTPEKEKASVVPDTEVQTPEDAAASSEGLPEAQPDADGESTDQPEADTEPADDSAASLPETGIKVGDKASSADAGTKTQPSTVDETADTAADTSATDKTSEKKKTEEKLQNNSTGDKPEAAASNQSRLKEGEKE